MSSRSEGKATPLGRAPLRICSRRASASRSRERTALIGPSGLGFVSTVFIAAAIVQRLVIHIMVNH
ncbi:Uncharacterised protein [Bordetella pertussis]|nr:Uncharacterised protein [Bordetella pertussis]CFP58822.1 Uncharacterised protein [Bordetella pertussis]CFW37347.1 Uncharacterised protein [Bordetella pertussis]